MENSIEKVQTLDSAFQATGRPRVDFSNVPEDLRAAIEGFYESIVQTEALNEGWTANWNDSNERKYIPWFDRSSGFAFDVTLCSYSTASAGCASRLFFKTDALARHAGQTPALMESYKKMMAK